MLINFITISQSRKKIKKDIPAEHIFTLIIGSLRFIVTQWKAEHFENDLIKTAQAHWHTIEKILINK